MSKPTPDAWLLLRPDKPTMVFLRMEDAERFVEPGNDAIFLPLYRKLDEFEHEVTARQAETKAAKRDVLALKQAMREKLGVRLYEEIEQRTAHLLFGS